MSMSNRSPLTTSTEDEQHLRSLLIKPNQLSQVDEPPKQEAEQGSSWLWYVGLAFAMVFGLGTGVTGAVGIIANGYPVAAGLSMGLFSFISNFYMTKNDVRKVLLGGIDRLYRLDDKDPNSDYMSVSKQRMLTVGIFLSTMFGLTYAALTFVGLIKLGAMAAGVAAFAPIAPAIPVIGAVLAVVTLVVQGSLMTKGFADILRIENLRLKARTWIGETFLGENPKDAMRRGTFSFWAERVVMAICASTLLIPVVLLISWGNINTLKSCAQGLSDILIKIPHATLIIADALSFSVAQVFAFAAQIPFILKVTVRPTVALFTRDFSDETVKVKPLVSMRERVAGFLEGTMIIVSAFLNSVCMGAIAMQGKERDVATILGGVGAIANGFVSSAVNAFISDDEEPKTELNVQVPVKTAPIPVNTGDINEKLGITPTLTSPSTPDLQLVERKEEALEQTHSYARNDSLRIDHSEERTSKRGLVV